MITLQTIALARDAESTADKLRVLAQRIDQASWDLDAALSAVEKDKAGYRRRNSANPSGGDNYQGNLEEALRLGEAYLAALQLTLNT